MIRRGLRSIAIALVCVFGLTAAASLLIGVAADVSAERALSGGYLLMGSLLFTAGALVVLWSLYRSTRDGDTPRVLALALVCAGAVGNLIDRVRSELGVVDFIDVGVGGWRWPTFNEADMAVSVGAFLLAWVLWGEDAAEHADRAEKAAEGAAAAPGAARGKPR